MRPMARLGNWISLVCTMCWLCGNLAEAQEQSPVVIDRQDLSRAVATLRDFLIASVQQHGGNIASEHLHIAFGLSTGHFASDPVVAQATRELATELATNLLVKGDTLRVYAWELGLWQYSPWAGQDITITSDDASAKRVQVARLWPLTPQSGSTGGHDTERAIAEIANHIGAGGGSLTGWILLLLTNDAASVNPRGQQGQIWGQDDPRYLSALSRYGLVRLPAVNRSGASIVLPFRAYVPEKGAVDAQLQAVVVISSAFGGYPLTPPYRWERLQSGSRGTGRPSLWMLLLLGAFGLVALVTVCRAVLRSVTSALQGHKVWILTVEKTPFELSGYKVNQEICQIAGPEYPEQTIYTVIVGTPEEMPPVCIARVFRRRDGVEVRAERFRIESVDGAIASGDSFVVRHNSRSTVRFLGQHPEGEALRPRKVRVDVVIEVSRSR